MKFIRRLFCFRQPQLEEFDYLPIVASQKVLLLLSWKLDGPFRVRVQGIKRKYSLKKGAVVVKLPSETSKVKVFVTSFWRRKRYTWNLQPVSLDSQSQSILINQFNPLLMHEIIHIDIEMNKFKVLIQSLKPLVKIATPNFSLPRININNQNLVYKP